MRLSSLLMFFQLLSFVISWQWEIDATANLWAISATACFTAGCTALGTKGARWGAFGGFFGGVFSALVATGYQTGVLKAGGRKRYMNRRDALKIAKDGFLDKVANSPLSTRIWSEMYDIMMSREDGVIIHDDGSVHHVLRRNGGILHKYIPASTAGTLNERDDSYSVEAYYDEKVEFAYDYQSNEDDMGNAVANFLDANAQDEQAFCSVLEQDDDQGEYAYIAFAVVTAGNDLTSTYNCESYN